MQHTRVQFACNKFAVLLTIPNILLTIRNILDHNSKPTSSKAAKVILLISSSQV